MADPPQQSNYTSQIILSATERREASQATHFSQLSALLGFLLTTISQRIEENRSASELDRIKIVVFFDEAGHIRSHVSVDFERGHHHEGPVR